MHRERLSRFIIFIGFQVETPACGIWPITAPPFFKNLFCTIITIEVVVVDKSPYPKKPRVLRVFVLNLELNRVSKPV